MGLFLQHLLQYADDREDMLNRNVVGDWAMLDNDGSNFLEHGFQPPLLPPSDSFHWWRSSPVFGGRSHDRPPL
jgi:hypothetical protein